MSACSLAETFWYRGHPQTLKPPPKIALNGLLNRFLLRVQLLQTKSCQHIWDGTSATSKVEYSCCSTVKSAHLRAQSRPLLFYSSARLVVFGQGQTTWPEQMGGGLARSNHAQIGRAFECEARGRKLRCCLQRVECISFDLQCRKKYGYFYKFERKTPKCSARWSREKGKQNHFMVRPKIWGFSAQRRGPSNHFAEPNRNHWTGQWR